MTRFLVSNNRGYNDHLQNLTEEKFGMERSRNQRPGPELFGRKFGKQKPSMRSPSEAFLAGILRQMQES